MKLAIAFPLLTLTWINLITAHHVMENEGMSQGDVLHDKPDKYRIDVPTDEQRWKNGVVPYEIDSGLPSSQRSVLYDAMNYLEKVSCLKFVVRNGENDYIRVIHGPGCYADLGRKGGQQYMSLGENCDNFAVGVHELMHAIGFEHEHNRSDRDDYLIIYWDNIVKKFWHAFKKAKPSGPSPLFLPFDFDSIMLYGSIGFVKRPKLFSMVARNGKPLHNFHEMTSLSKTDLHKVKLFYQCNCAYKLRYVYSNWTAVVLIAFLRTGYIRFHVHNSVSHAPLFQSHVRGLRNLPAHSSSRIEKVNILEQFQLRLRRAWLISNVAK